MIFRETPLRGAYEIELELRPDERGFFARSYCWREFEQQQLNPRLVQCSISYNRQRGTLRGMHYQEPPHDEVKVVRCTRGAIYDVIIDLRRESSTYCRWHGVEMRAPAGEASRMLYIPSGFAHGFLTLEDESEVSYQMSEFYTPNAARGVRWNDPAFGIAWPEPVRVIAERDRTYPDYQPKKAVVGS